MHNIIFFEVTEPKEAYRSAVNNLLTQLSQNAKPMTIDEMTYMATCNESHLFFLCIDNKIIGMSTLAVYRSPIGCKVWIEDVVVDRNFRGKGYGKLMILQVMELCRKRGEVTLMLTSRPSRVVANQLYQSLGFEKRETNVYKMKF